jgi:hypothetical protein
MNNYISINNNKTGALKEGDLVTILVPLQSKVRDNKPNDALVNGTICAIYGEEVSVLLDGGEIYKGLRRNVIKASTQTEK